MTYGVDPNAEPVGFRRLYDDVGIVDLDTPTEIVAPGADRDAGLRRVRRVGRASSCGTRSPRAPGTSCRRLPADLFGADPSGLWMRVLRRQPGELAWVSTQPADPTMN